MKRLVPLDLFILAPLDCMTPVVQATQVRAQAAGTESLTLETQWKIMTLGTLNHLIPVPLDTSTQEALEAPHLALRPISSQLIFTPSMHPDLIILKILVQMDL